MHTAFIYNQDTCDSYALHIEEPLTSADIVWKHIFRKELKIPDLRDDEVARMVDELGDDIMDYNIVAVIPGKHECMFAQLPQASFSIYNTNDD